MDIQGVIWGVHGHTGVIFDVLGRTGGYLGCPGEGAEVPTNGQKGPQPAVFLVYTILEEYC